MRLSAYGEIERTWLIDALRDPRPEAGMDDFLSSQPAAPRRRVLFIRLSQTLADLLAAIPRWRVRELVMRAGCTLPDPVPPIIDLLGACGVDLTRALAVHQAMGGDARIAELNRVGTHFSALSEQEIDGLHAHALWQVHVMRALYWD